MDFVLSKRPFRTDRRDCGELVRLIRRQSLSDFAKSLGVSPCTVSSFEAERYDSSRLCDEYNRLSNEYGLNILLGYLRIRRKDVLGEVDVDG